MSQGKKKGCLCLLLALAMCFPAVRRCIWAALFALLAASAAARPIRWLESKRFPRWLGVALVLGGNGSAGRRSAGLGRGQTLLCH